MVVLLNFCCSFWCVWFGFVDVLLGWWLWLFVIGIKRWVSGLFSRFDAVVNTGGNGCNDLSFFLCLCGEDRCKWRDLAPSRLQRKTTEVTTDRQFFFGQLNQFRFVQFVFVAASLKSNWYQLKLDAELNIPKSKWTKTWLNRCSRLCKLPADHQRHGGLRRDSTLRTTIDDSNDDSTKVSVTARARYVSNWLFVNNRQY